MKPICADSAGLLAEPHEEEEKKEACRGQCRGEHVGTEALEPRRESNEEIDPAELSAEGTTSVPRPFLGPLKDATAARVI